MRTVHILLGLFIRAVHSPYWSIDAFNIETKHYTSYHGPQDSMFGFSVAGYRDKYKEGWWASNYINIFNWRMSLMILNKSVL